MTDASSLERITTTTSPSLREIVDRALVAMAAVDEIEDRPTQSHADEIAHEAEWSAADSARREAFEAFDDAVSVSEIAALYAELDTTRAALAAAKEIVLDQDSKLVGYLAEMQSLHAALGVTTAAYEREQRHAAIQVDEVTKLRSALREAREDTRRLTWLQERVDGTGDSLKMGGVCYWSIALQKGGRGKHTRLGEGSDLREAIDAASGMDEIDPAFRHDADCTAMYFDGSGQPKAGCTGCDYTASHLDAAASEKPA